MGTDLWSFAAGRTMDAQDDGAAAAPGPADEAGLRGEADAGNEAGGGDEAGGLAPGQRIARGVCRAFALRRLASLTEFTLKSGRRADVIALDGAGEIAIVEVKSSRADFVSDAKWADYLEFCDRFYFAVPPEFPRELLPGGCGLIVADGYGAEILRDAPAERLHASRRRAVMLRFARTASQRLTRREDPTALMPE